MSDRLKMETKEKQVWLLWVASSLPDRRQAMIRYYDIHVGEDELVGKDMFKRRCHEMFRR